MNNIGEKNRYISIWKHAAALNSANEPDPNDWVMHKSKWARVMGESGMGTIRSAASAGGINTDIANYSFRVNFDASLIAGMQIRDAQGFRYTVVGVRHDMANRDFTDMIAELGSRDGKPQTGS